jgi:hypothetical protein
VRLDLPAGDLSSPRYATRPTPAAHKRAQFGDPASRSRRAGKS